MENKTEYESQNPEQTFAIAKELGQQAQAGDVFCLIGDLGVGKTLFSQGFANGMGVEDYVNSPTFTIVQEYDGSDRKLYHFDVYLEIYIPGIQNTGGDRSCHMDISGCKNCNMYVSTE